MAKAHRIGRNLGGLRIEGTLARPPAIEVIVDGAPLEARPGESIIAALMVAGRRGLRTSPRLRQPRGGFCMMGVCQECLIRADGRLMPACQTTVRAGMLIETGGADE